MPTHIPKNSLSDLTFSREYAADLGNPRRSQRARKVGVALALKPELSFPKVFPDEAGLEAAYRLGWLMVEDSAEAYSVIVVDRPVDSGLVAVDPAAQVEHQDRPFSAQPPLLPVYQVPRILLTAKFCFPCLVQLRGFATFGPFSSYQAGCVDQSFVP